MAVARNHVQLVQTANLQRQRHHCYCFPCWSRTASFSRIWALHASCCQSLCRLVTAQTKSWSATTKKPSKGGKRPLLRPAQAYWQYVDKCSDYWTPGHRLLHFAEQRPDAVLRWPTQDSLPVPYPASCATAGSSGTITAECYKSTVQHNLQGNSALNATIPAGRGERRKECGVCGAKVFVYIYNCFSQPGADMLVHVDLRQVQNVAKDDRCYTLRDQVALDLLAVSVFLMAACAVAFLLPTAVSVGWNAAQNLVRQCRQRIVSAEVG